jgi:beta-glucosidase
VKLLLGERDLSYVSEAGTRLIGAGTYELSVGGGQPGTGAPATTTTFNITGEKQLPR